MLIEDRLKDHVVSMKAREAKLGKEIDILCSRLDTLQAERKILEKEMLGWEEEAMDA